MDKVDVVIVGSGASGSVLAAELAVAGKRVVVLEGGPERQVSDLYSSQIWARRIKWFGPNTQTEGPEPVSVHFGSGWGTGGAALHHYAVWLRRHADDFNMRSRFGEGLDWPFFYEDLQPYYDRIQEEVGISGDAEAEIWRPAGTPYPMPPRPLFRQATLIAGGFTKLGLHTSPLPMAINSVEYKGRPACVNDGWCDAGCPILALANPLAVYLPMAKKAGAELRHESYVTRTFAGEKNPPRNRSRILRQPGSTVRTACRRSDCCRLHLSDAAIAAELSHRGPAAWNGELKRFGRSLYDDALVGKHLRNVSRRDRKLPRHSRWTVIVARWIR